MPVPWTAILAGGASLLGGNAANVASAREAQRNRDFQERMSSTSHQREVKDLRLAGLNPILSATKGASTPGGSMAQQKDIATPAVNSALSAKLQNAQIDNINMDTNLKHSKSVESSYIQNNLGVQNLILQSQEQVASFEAYKSTIHQAAYEWSDSEIAKAYNKWQQIQVERETNSAFNALDSLPNQPLLKQYKGLDSSTMKRKKPSLYKGKIKRKN